MAEATKEDRLTSSSLAESKSKKQSYQEIPVEQPEYTVAESQKEMIL